jgi:hypothetical protein
VRGTRDAARVGRAFRRATLSDAAAATGAVVAPGGDGRALVVGRPDEVGALAERLRTASDRGLAAAFGAVARGL